jgi:hypothetical protein
MPSTAISCYGMAEETKAQAMIILLYNLISSLFYPEVAL